MPKYRYGLNENNQLVDVMDLTRTDDSNIGLHRCLGCGRELVAKIKGEHRVKHFAHKSLHSCSNETYLHRVGKEMFRTKYEWCLKNNEPFEIERDFDLFCYKKVPLTGQPCPVGKKMSKRFDLTITYDALRLEQRDGDFVPDVLLFDSSNPTNTIYVEIAVTSMLSLKKKRSNNVIIELKIEKEDDLACIQNGLITAKEASFVNFNQESKAADRLCGCGGEMYWAFIISEEGRVHLRILSVVDISQRLATAKRRPKYQRFYRSGNPMPEEDRLKLYIQEASQRVDYPIINCHLCACSRIRNIVDYDEPVYCRAYGRTVHSNHALSCEGFQSLENK